MNGSFSYDENSDISYKESRNNEEIEFNISQEINNHNFGTSSNNRLYRGQQFFDKPNENLVDELSWRKPKHVEQIINQREALISQLCDYQYECTICYVVLKPDHPVWSCDNCFHIFHTDCIKKWYKTCVDDLENVKWRCPTCQKEYTIADNEIVYRCFCGKVQNPGFKRGNVMHSCDNTCGKRNRTNGRCPHLCPSQCHPGPCPNCEASLTSDCHCGKVTLTVKCSISEYQLMCGDICDSQLNCGVHHCEAMCHPGDCIPCIDTVTQSCHCERETRIVTCGSDAAHQSSFSCNNVCNGTKDCNNHQCEKECHPGPCDSCALLPEKVKFCQCGQTPLKDLVESQSEEGDRRSCRDQIPTCVKKCDKHFRTCGHSCPSICHENDCAACPLSSDVKCRCKRTSQNIKCSELARLDFLGRVVVCSNRCKVKKLCGIHRCNEKCCDKQVHVCEQICRKLLSCRMHLCERTCHPGNCPVCPNVTFDELYCHCGVTVSLPPIACGQQPPICRQVCSRSHSCSHDVLHNCHNEPVCPPCTVLTRKPCPGGHRILDNIPCFRPVATCGSPCSKPLPNCQHLCNKSCHLGSCTTETFVCSQPCEKVRPVCLHPCSAPCHEGVCEAVMKPCSVKIDLKCPCKNKSVMIVCDKLQQTIRMIRTAPDCNLKKEGLELVLSDKDNSVYLNCDSDCKKAARSKQYAEAFEMEISTSENVSYAGFLRDFAIKDPNFLIKIDGEFIKLIKKLETEKLTKAIYRFEPMNRDKRRFIHELSKYFCLKTQSSDPDPKRFVTIEAIKGICKVPNSRLLQFMQKNYPQIFKSDKQLSLKFHKIR